MATSAFRPVAVLSESEVTRPLDIRLPTLLASCIGLALGSSSVLASERWADYAVASMTPAYDWAEAEAEAPTLLDAQRSHADAFVSSLRLSVAEHMTVHLAVDRSLESAPLSTDRIRGSDFAGRADWNGLEQRRFTADLERSFSDQSSLSAGVVLVHQSYASAGLGGASAEFGRNERPLAGFEQLSYGTGVRLGFVQPLAESLWFDAEYRSRVDMDALLGYRGLYGDVGNFDLPATSSASIGLAATPKTRVSLGVTRVMHSAVPTFSSNLLPTRLLAQLNDGGSPEFKWRDLTVYSMDWSWQPKPEHRWTLHYSTSQQPDTTSALLSSALGPEIRDGYNVGGSYAFMGAGGSSWRFGLSYSPVSYLYGHSLRQRRDLNGPMLEVETAWSVPF